MQCRITESFVSQISKSSRTLVKHIISGLSIVLFISNYDSTVTSKGHWKTDHLKKMSRCNSSSISQEICTRFLLCCALLWLYIDWFSHIHQAYFTGTVAAKQPWRIWINTSCEFIMNDYITTTKQSTTKPCAYFLGYTVYVIMRWSVPIRTFVK